MENEIKINDHTEWHGEYKGISFEIVKWKGDYSKPELKEYDRGYTWNYYIYVKPREIILADSWGEGKKRIDYSKMYEDVEMHGGLTFLTELTTSSLSKLHKIGCDYGHSWDYEDDMSRKLKENKMEWILKDVQETIDKLPQDLFFPPNH